MIRDGNGTRSFETLLRYRAAAMAEFWQALKTLKALQAEQAAQAAGTGLAMAAPASRPAARVAHRPEPNEPERHAGLRLDYVLPDAPVPARTLHEPATPWLPNEPGAGRHAASAPAARGLVANEPEPHRVRGPDQRAPE